MRNLPYIMRSVQNCLIKLLMNKDRVKVIGARGTGKRTIIQKICEDLNRRRIPYHVIQVFHDGDSSFYNENNDPLILSIFYGNKNVKKKYNHSKRSSDFLCAAEAVIKHLTSAKEKGILIINNYEKLGPCFIDRLTQVFWNLKQIRILLTMEPNIDNIGNNYILNDFYTFNLKANFLNFIFKTHNQELFSDLSLNDKQQKFLLKTGNFAALQYFIKNPSAIEDKDSQAFDSFFNFLIDNRGKNAFNLLQNSAVIGFLFEQKYLIDPLKVENSPQILQMLCGTGELKLADAKLNKYEFAYEELFQYILNKISSENYKKLTKTLADYFFDKANHFYNTTNIKLYFEMLYKSFLYYVENGTVDNVISIFFPLVNYLYCNYQHDDVIYIVEKIMQSNIDIEIKLYIGHRMIDLLNEWAIHSKTKQFIALVRKLQSAYAVRGYDSLYTFLQEAEYYYLKGGEKLTYDLLCKIKSSTEYIQADEYLNYRVNALLSSVLYNIADKCKPEEPNQYYQYAINYGQNICDDYYYKLLQKSVIFDSNYTQDFLKKACDFFQKKDNSIELAKTQNNLGVYYLEKGKYELAQECFKKADFLLSSHLANNLRAMPLNNLAAILMLKGEFKKAKKILFKADEYNNGEEFTFITIAFNISACCYKLNEDTNSQLYYEKATNKIIKSSHGSSHFYAVFKQVHEALKAFNNKEESQAVKILQEIKTPHLFYRQLIEYITGQPTQIKFYYPYLKDVLSLSVCPHYMVFE